MKEFPNQPKLEDFYDKSDPRGISTREFDMYEKALKKWQAELEIWKLSQSSKNDTLRIGSSISRALMEWIINNPRESLRLSNGETLIVDIGGRKLQITELG